MGRRRGASSDAPTPRRCHRSHEPLLGCAKASRRWGYGAALCKKYGISIENPLSARWPGIFGGVSRKYHARCRAGRHAADMRAVQRRSAGAEAEAQLYCPYRPAHASAHQKTPMCMLQQVVCEVGKWRAERLAKYLKVCFAIYVAGYICLLNGFLVRYVAIQSGS